MRIFLLIVFSLFLTACNKMETAEIAPTSSESSVQIEGEYKGEHVTEKPQKIVFKTNGEFEFHQYYSDGKPAGVYSGEYVIVGNKVNITGVPIPYSYQIKENGKMMLGSEVFVKVK